MKKITAVLLVLMSVFGAVTASAFAGKQCQCNPCKCNPPCECVKK